MRVIVRDDERRAGIRVIYPGLDWRDPVVTEAWEELTKALQRRWEETIGGESDEDRDAG